MFNSKDMKDSEGDPLNSYSVILSVYSYWFVCLRLMAISYTTLKFQNVNKLQAWSLE